MNSVKNRNHAVMSFFADRTQLVRKWHHLSSVCLSLRNVVVALRLKKYSHVPGIELLFTSTETFAVR